MAFASGKGTAQALRHNHHPPPHPATSLCGLLPQFQGGGVPSRDAVAGEWRLRPHLQPCEHDSWPAGSASTPEPAASQHRPQASGAKVMATLFVCAVSL